ncbi:hypothetical protein [Mucilaginibacter sp.]
MKQALVYSIKVWLTSALVVPFIQMIEGLIIGNHTSISNAEQMILLALLFGLLLSMPSWLLLWMSASLLNRLTGSVLVIKLSLTVLSTALAILPFFLLAGTTSLSSHDLIWFGPYPIIVVACIWLYKLNSAPVIDSDNTFNLSN